MTTDILFFDIPTNLQSPGPTSPNTWKVRFALNMKKLKYTTQWVNTPDIEATLKPLGIAPTGVKPDGAPHYTLPAIIDRTNPEYPILLSDSTPIIEYLEKTYPTPGINFIPKSSKGLQQIFEHFLLQQTFLPAYLDLFIMPAYHTKPESERQAFVTRMEARFGKSIDQIDKQGGEREAAWKQLENDFGVIAAAYDLTEGPYMMGNDMTITDLWLAGVLVWMKALSPEEGWGRMSTWHGGRWARFLQSFSEFMAVDNHPA